MIVRYNGFYHDGETWLALLGSAEFTRRDLERAVATESGEQRSEVERALADLPPDGTLPTRAQRRKVEPAEGQLDA